MAGELYASGTVARGLLQMLASGLVEAPWDNCGRLSDRELQVFRLIGSGFGTSRVATELQLSVKTIETHRQRIKQKLGLTNGTELTRRAAEWMMDAARNRASFERGATLQRTPRALGFDASLAPAARGSESLCDWGFRAEPSPLSNDARRAAPVDALIPSLAPDRTMRRGAGFRPLK